MRWEEDSGLREDRFLSITDWPNLTEWALLEPGDHTLTLVVDPTDLVDESNEGDNSYTVDFFVEGSDEELSPDQVIPKLPNLTPYTPREWSAPILAYSKINDVIVDTLSTDVPTCLRLSVWNSGLSRVQGRSVAHLYFDDLLVNWRAYDGFGSGFKDTWSEWCGIHEVVDITPGEHTLKLVVDATDFVSESDEEDNAFAQTFSWGTGSPEKVSFRNISAVASPLPADPNLTPFVPPGWSGAVVLGLDTGIFSPVFFVEGQPGFIHWAIKNDSGTDMVSGYDVELRIDGRQVALFERPPLEAGTIDFEINYSLPDVFLSHSEDAAQPLKLSLISDPEDWIVEGNEDDNVFERDVLVLGEIPPAPDPIIYTAEELQILIFQLEGLLLVTENTVTTRDEPFLDEVMDVMDAVYFALYGKRLEEEEAFVHVLTEGEYDSWIEIQCLDFARRFGEEEDFEKCVERSSATVGFQTTWQRRNRIIMRGEVTPASLIETFAHELGHLREELVNPNPFSGDENSLNVRALQEAQAYVHTMVVLRMLEEQLETQLLQYPAQASMTFFIDGTVERYLDQMDQDEHERGRLFIWSAVLSDGRLAHLKEELVETDRLSLASTIELFDFLLDIPWEIADAYVGEILGSLGEHIDAIKSTSAARLISGLHYLQEGSPEFREGGLLLP